MVEDHYHDGPPPLEQRIERLHVWIATYPNGSEGIVSGDMPMPAGLGTRHMPLMSSRLELARALQPLARRAQRLATDHGRPIVSIRLVSYRREGA